MRTPAVVLSLAAVLAAAPAAAQPESLATLYALGGAVSDTNGDGVADRLNARVVLPGSPSAAEVAIAADLAARLGGVGDQAEQARAALHIVEHDEE